MRTVRGVVLVAAAAIMLAGCGEANKMAGVPPAAQQTTSSTPAPDVLESRAIELVQTGVPGTTDAEARQLMRMVCDRINNAPTAETLKQLRLNIAGALGGGVPGAARANAVIGAAVVWACPKYRELAEQSLDN